MKRYLAPLVASLLAASSVFAAPPEVRGTWLTTTANDAISSPEKTAETMKRLREIGLNVVYIECWKQGYTEFPSDVMQKLVGESMKINAAPKELQRDLLGETVIEAHRNEMLAIAWFEYGFMTAWKDSEPALRKLAREKGWLLLDKDGNEVGKQNSFAWLNPLHPEAQKLILDITLEAIRKYDLDGVQLDDRIAMPVDMGYDKFTVDLYKKEHNGEAPPTEKNDPKWDAWVQWRADKISEYSIKYVRAIRAAHPDILISVSPAPYPWSLENYACDWIKWTKWCYCGGNKWSEYLPQTYRMNGDATIKSIDEQIHHMGEEKVYLVPGVRVVGDGPDMPWPDMVKVLDYIREKELAGHCLWFSRGVLEVYPEQFKAYYDVAKNGHAQHPFKPGDHRPAPIVASKGANNAWKATVETGGRYRVIVKQNGRWSEAVSQDFKPGDHTLVFEADAVELLADRRP